MFLASLAILHRRLAKFKKELNKKIDKISSENKMMQQLITSQNRSNEDVIKKCKENEQYGRRLYLSIRDISRKKKREI